MVGLNIAFSVVIIILCIATVVMILMQKKRTAGLSGAMTGSSNSNTYWGKNKSRSVEGRLEFFTKISGSAILILCLIMTIVN